MNTWDLPNCSCGRPMFPFMDGERQFGLYGYGCAMLCGYCDGAMLPGPSAQMWLELENLEAGSWPRRVRDLFSQPDDPS